MSNINVLLASAIVVVHERLVTSLLCVCVCVCVLLRQMHLIHWRLTPVYLLIIHEFLVETLQRVVCLSVRLSLLVGRARDRLALLDAISLSSNWLLPSHARYIHKLLLLLLLLLLMSCCCHCFGIWARIFCYIYPPLAQLLYSFHKMQRLSLFCLCLYMGRTSILCYNLFWYPFKFAQSNVE